MSHRFEIDHLFITASRDAPEVEQLRRLGFHEGEPNVHPGLGTACRRIFFENAYLELIWLEDRAEASAPAIAPTRLAAPGCRPADPDLAVHAAVPAEGSVDPHGGELTGGIRAAALLPALGAPVDGAAGAAPQPHPRRITDVAITLPAPIDPSPALTWLGRSGTARLGSGPAERLALTLDGGAQGQSTALSTVPLTAEW